MGYAEDYAKAYGTAPPAQPTPGLDPAADALAADNYASREPSGILGNVFDFLARPRYASAAFFDKLVEGGSTGDAFSAGASELLSPTKRLGFSDVVTHYDPEFAKNNPFATKALGFIGD